MNIKKQKLSKIFMAVMVMAMVVMSAVVVASIVPATVVNAATAPSLNKKSRNILVGKQYDFNIKNKAKKSTYKWTTSDKKVATVNNKGVVTGVKQGTATITCTITVAKEKHVLTAKVTIIEPALSFRIKNKITGMNLGQVYDLNRSLAPSTSGDKTTWSSNNNSIAKPDSLGKFTALNMGTVTITGKTLSGAKDSVTIKVFDKVGTVNSQADLDAIVGSGAAMITIKTDEVATFTIPAGTYKKQTLVIDAPNAVIENNGEFKAIEIQKLGKGSWYERAASNQIKVLSQDTKMVVGTSSSPSIEFDVEKANVTLENNGTIKNITILKSATVVITGKSTSDIPTMIKATGVKVTTTLPLDLVATEKAELILKTGAEKSKIKVDAKEDVPSITGNTTIKVVVGEGDKAYEVTVIGTPIATESTGGGAGGGGGGGSNPSTPSDKVDVVEHADGYTTYKLPKSYTEIKSIDIAFAGLTLSVDSTLLDTFKNFLSNDSATVATWLNTTDTTKEYGGQTVKVTGVKDSNTKKVEFTSGLLSGKSYTVTVDSANNSVTLVNNDSNVTYTVSRVGTTTLKIDPTPKGLTFTPKF